MSRFNPAFERNRRNFSADHYRSSEEEISNFEGLSQDERNALQFTQGGVPLGKWEKWVEELIESNLSTPDCMDLMQVFIGLCGDLPDVRGAADVLRTQVRVSRSQNEHDAFRNVDIFIPPNRSEIEAIQLSMRELNWRIRRNASTGLTEVQIPDPKKEDSAHAEDWVQMTDDIEATILAHIEKHCLTGDVAKVVSKKGKSFVQWSQPQPMKVNLQKLERAIRVERRENEVDTIFESWISPLMKSEMYGELEQEISKCNGEIPAGWLLNDVLSHVADIPDVGDNKALAKHFGVGVIGACVARQFRPGAEHDQMFLLIGRQGGFKSGLIRNLVPETKLYTNMIRADLKAQELIHHTRGRMLCEIPEMVGFSRKRMEDFTSFCSTHVDGARMVYERYETLWPRRWIVVGTTNNFRILPYADTGNRRFIPIRVERHKEKNYEQVLEWLQFNRKQIWAEAIAWYHSQWKGPYSAHLPRELESAQEKACRIYSDVGALENSVRHFLDVGLHIYEAEEQGVVLTHDEIFEVMDRADPSNSDRNRAGRLLKSRNIEQTSVRRQDGKTHKAFRFDRDMIEAAVKRHEDLKQSGG